MSVFGCTVLRHVRCLTSILSGHPIFDSLELDFGRFWKSSVEIWLMISFAVGYFWTSYLDTSMFDFGNF